jgi:hypothetical protein
MPDAPVVIEVYGEGKTDVGHDPSPQRPTRGVVPILLSTLCGKPSRMRVKRYGMPFMQGRGKLAQKVRFAKRQARLNRSAGVTFVVDSEGDLKGRSRDLERGRRMEPGEFPMAVGVAHPCIESWLLADPMAIRRALDLPGNPPVPDEPESLPAPRQDRRNNPKTALAATIGGSTRELSVAEKEKITAAMNDMDLLRTRCPQGFAAFADEVQAHIRPLFGDTTAPAGGCP